MEPNTNEATAPKRLKTGGKKPPVSYTHLTLPTNSLV